MWFHGEYTLPNLDKLIVNNCPLWSNTQLRQCANHPTLVSLQIIECPLNPPLNLYLETSHFTELVLNNVIINVPEIRSTILACQNLLSANFHKSSPTEFDFINGTALLFHPHLEKLVTPEGWEMCYTGNYSGALMWPGKTSVENATANLTCLSPQIPSERGFGTNFSVRNQKITPNQMSFEYNTGRIVLNCIPRGVFSYYEVHKGKSLLYKLVVQKQNPFITVNLEMLGDKKTEKLNLQMGSVASNVPINLYGHRFSYTRNVNILCLVPSRCNISFWLPILSLIIELLK